MSGHSHWHSIKYQKGTADAKKSKTFSKISRLISIAVKEGGEDLVGNPKLRLAIEQAKSFNMPKDRIEKAIKRGTGEIEGEKLEEFMFEAYGPGGVAIIIEGITNNKNRSINEVKQILNQNEGKLANEGSVKWLFERKGVIEINYKNQIQNTEKEDLELIAIEAGAEDIQWDKDIISIYTQINNLEKVKNNLKTKNIKIESFSLDWIAKESIDIDEQKKESCQKLLEMLEENDDIQRVFLNIVI